MNRRLKRISIFIGSFLNAKIGHRLPRKLLEFLQCKRFKLLQKHVLVLSPYYVNYADKPLDEYPFVNKALHVDNFNTINTVKLDKKGVFDTAIAAEKNRDFKPVYKGFSVGLSSGTSGSRGLFVTSEEEQAQWAGYIIGKLLPFRWGRHRVAFFLRANNNLYETANGFLLSFKFFDLVAGVDKNIAVLETFDPTILIAPVSVLLKIAQCEARIHPVKVIAVAEVLDESSRQALEIKFQQKIHQVYQCTEGFLAVTCNQGNLHLNEDMVIIEKQWIDKKSGRFYPVVTDLKRKTQPIIRYLLDDILIEDKNRCVCGSSFTRLASIEGRKDDIVRLADKHNNIVDVFPDFIRNTIVAASDEICEYQVTQIKHDTLIISTLPFNRTLQNDITDALNELFSRLEVLKPCYLFEQFEYEIGGQKRRRIKRLING